VSGSAQPALPQLVAILTLSSPKRPAVSWRSARFSRFPISFVSRSGTCPWPPRNAVALAQRIIEMVVGRLITDEEFRSEFVQDPEKTLLALFDRGLYSSRTEIAALVTTDSALWAQTADAIHPRVQKASLKNETRLP
jgi:hypothetical protein